MPFPLVKLGYLAVKQISKPLANAIKQKAKTTPFLRNRILLPPAQLYHRFETEIKMRLLGLGNISQVKPLSEEMAVELAADMLGEAVIFGVASLCLLLEYKRQQRKDANKEDVQNQRLLGLEKQVSELTLEIEEQSTRLREIYRVLRAEELLDKSLMNDKLPQTIVDPLENSFACAEVRHIVNENIQKFLLSQIVAAPRQNNAQQNGADQMV